MKIVYITPISIPSRAAHSVHVMKMCQALAKNGHEVVLIISNIVSKDMEHLTDEVFNYYNVDKCFEIIKMPVYPIPGKYYFFGLFAALKAKHLNADLVYSRSISVAYFASLFKNKSIYEAHSIIDRMGMLNNFLFKKMLQNKNFALLVCISSALEDILASKYSNATNKIFVAHDGADPIDKIGNKPLAGNNQRLQVGYIGHLYKGRGIDIIIELARRSPWADFHIIGGQPDDLKHWKNLTQALKNIRFYGHLPYSKSEEYRVAMDVLLAPYQTTVETAGGINSVKWMSPLKVFEYMAAGKPIICSDLPVLKEVLVHKQNAILCHPSNIDTWGKSLIELNENEELRKNLGKRALRDFLDKYTWKSRAANIIQKVQ